MSYTENVPREAMLKDMQQRAARARKAAEIHKKQEAHGAAGPVYGSEVNEAMHNGHAEPSTEAVELFAMLYDNDPALAEELLRDFGGDKEAIKAHIDSTIRV